MFGDKEEKKKSAEEEKAEKEKSEKTLKGLRTLTKGLKTLEEDIDAFLGESDSTGLIILGMALSSFNKSTHDKLMMCIKRDPKLGKILEEKEKKEKTDKKD